MGLWSPLTARHPVQAVRLAAVLPQLSVLHRRAVLLPEQAWCDVRARGGTGEADRSVSQRLMSAAYGRVPVTSANCALWAMEVPSTELALTVANDRGVSLWGRQMVSESRFSAMRRLRCSCKPKRCWLSCASVSEVRPCYQKRVGCGRVIADGCGFAVFTWCR